MVGPRYWQQDLQGSALQDSAGSAAAGSRTVYVQRKQGTLGYAEDPSGMRSLLNSLLKVGFITI